MSFCTERKKDENALPQEKHETTFFLSRLDLFFALFRADYGNLRIYWVINTQGLGVTGGLKMSQRITVTSIGFLSLQGSGSGDEKQHLYSELDSWPLSSGHFVETFQATIETPH